VTRHPAAVPRADRSRARPERRFRRIRRSSDFADFADIDPFEITLMGFRLTDAA
jgi:hypothetical protein